MVSPSKTKIIISLLILGGGGLAVASMDKPSVGLIDPGDWGM